MTSYHGGKQRTGKQIATNIYLVSTIIEEHTDFTVKGYCEPFCGMLGVYRHIPELFEDHVPKLKYKAGDTNESVIKMWHQAQMGWEPPTDCTKKRYTQLKNNGVSLAEKGFIGHASCFGGQYFGSYSEDKVSDFPAQSKRVGTIAQQVLDVDFTHGGYSQFGELKDYVIYCDPPYLNTENRYYDESGVKRGFDYDLFMLWCQKMAQKNIVLVSEYDLSIPSICVWNKKTIDLLYQGRKATGAEGLYLVT